MLPLYPAVEPFTHYHLTVDNVSNNEKQLDIDRLATGKPVTEHHIYVEQCGNPAGSPVVFLHGGPGVGCKPSHRCFFDPKRYHIILFDQRGCGRSRPHCSLAQNTTQHLIQDMEKIRLHIGIEKWLIFGGSWGSTLGLYYAHYYTKHVSGLILRGIFLARQQDIDWVYSENGAAKIFPEAWNNLIKDLPTSQQAEPLAAIYQQLTSNDIGVSNNIFNKIEHWESSLVYWQRSLVIKDYTAEKHDKAPSIIQIYYSVNHCFIEQTPLLELIKTIRHIPTAIIHGRLDMICPADQAWQLKQHFPEAKLSIIDMAGHVANETKMTDALINATNYFAAQHSLVF
jgi:proline iminopeptidase